jgi:hypothetical protein
MLKPTESTLKKLEDLFKHLSYKVRYEKGQFQSGYCLVKSQKILVVNKFYTTEARINCLVEILQEVEIEACIFENMDESLQKIVKEINKEIKVSN